MKEETTLDTLKRLIVGRRGRARADRLLVTSADGAQREIIVKAQRNAASYVDLVDSCAPVRIEAYAGRELLAAWGEAPAPRRPAKKSAPTTSARKTASAPPPAPEGKKKRRPDMALVVQLTTHMNTLLASAYKVSAEKETAAWASLAQIAQHHADRAGNAELRNETAQKSIRLRDKAINDRDSLILRLNAKIQEIANEGDDDKKSQAFMQLLKIAGGENHPVAQAVAAASGNGAKKKEAS